MPGFFLSVFRLIRFLMSGDGAIAIENAALRLQLAAFQRKRKRPVLTSFDRLFWVGLSLIWNRWRAALVYVQSDTVVRWQRERFRKFWAHLSRVNRRRRGRPATGVDRFLHGADGHHEGAVRVHRTGTPSSRGAAFQRD